MSESEYGIADAVMTPAGKGIVAGVPTTEFPYYTVQIISDGALYKCGRADLQPADPEEPQEESSNRVQAKYAVGERVTTLSGITGTVMERWCAYRIGFSGGSAGIYEEGELQSKPSSPTWASTAMQRPENFAMQLAAGGSKDIGVLQETIRRLDERLAKRGG